MRTIHIREDAEPHELRHAAVEADQNREEAEGQVEFWTRFARDLRTMADDLELEHEDAR